MRSPVSGVFFCRAPCQVICTRIEFVAVKMADFVARHGLWADMRFGYQPMHGESLSLAINK